MEHVERLVRVDQKPIGRTPRSNLATYTGLFDHVRKLFAATKAARARRYDAGRFSFNVAKGRCENCEGEGFVMVELLFLPSVYAPCPACHGARYNAKTLEITYRGKNIADVLGMTVDAACEFFADEPHVRRALDVLREVGLGYLRLGQPATELSGGEAQRIKLATELQRAAARRHALRPRRADDRPASGRRREADGAARRPGRRRQHRRSSSSTTCASSAASDWVIDIGPGAGDEGGRVVAAGPPAEVAPPRRAGRPPISSDSSTGWSRREGPPKAPRLDQLRGPGPAGRSSEVSISSLMLWFGASPDPGTD